MLTRNEFNSWFLDFGNRFPAVRDYANRQEMPERLLDTWHQTLAAFTAETLGGVTKAMMAGELEPVPNTQLGQFGHEIRMRTRELLDLRRQHVPQDWHETAKPLPVTQMLKEPRMNWMQQCAKAVDRLLGGAEAKDAYRYQNHGSVNPQRGSYEAAIIMADEHSDSEAVACSAAFAKDGLSWETITAEARQPSASKEPQR